MNMIEIYEKDGSIIHLINANIISEVFDSDTPGSIRIETYHGDDCIYSYETLENFQKRTGDPWVELDGMNDSIKIKKSEVVAYKIGEGRLYFWLRGNRIAYQCDESIESFERKIGIKKEKTE